MKFVTSSQRIRQFRDMSIPSELLMALARMKITKPTDIQTQAIPAAINGQDVIAIAQTGSGKTLAYALTVLTQLNNKPDSRALVLAPSREMAQQIHKVFTDLCVDLPASVCLAIGGTSGSKQANELKNKPRVIIATPGRMNDHLLGNKLLLQGVEFLVVDEADRMLDMGFAPQLKAIENTLRGDWQTLMFSASFGEKVESIAELFMGEEVLMIRTEDAETPVDSLKQKVIFLDRKQKTEVLLDELNKTKGNVLIFTGNQESCDFVADFVDSYGFGSDHIHGAMTQGQRNRVIRNFREGSVRIVVATDLLARGIDVPTVTYVINYDLPFQSEDFLHRIGRTARAGRKGEALTFVTPSDQRMYKKIQKYLEGAEEIKFDPQFKFIERNLKSAQATHSGKPVRRETRGAGDRETPSTERKRTSGGAPKPKSKQQLQGMLKGLFGTNAKSAGGKSKSKRK